MRKISDVMTRQVKVVKPDDTVHNAARMMADQDVGALPVCDGTRLLGMITDRDIAIRGVAKGKAPDTPIRDVMTDDVKYCFDDEEVDDVARNMADIQVRRLPVVNRETRLVGIIAIADLAANEDPEVVGEAVSGISEPAGDR